MDEDLSKNYRYEIVEDGDENHDPLVAYFDEDGNDVTPLPFNIPEGMDGKDAENGKRVRSRVPRPNTIMRTFLHVTTALYSMAGLGSLEQSKFFKEELANNKSLDEGGMKSFAEGNTGGGKLLEEDTLDMERPASQLKAEEDHEAIAEKFKAVKSSTIDILLTETDTIWMLNIAGTCLEVDPDKKKTEEEIKKEKEAEEKAKKPPAVVHKYKMVERFSQTLDFSKKKKGAQTDEIVLGFEGTQVSTKDFLEEERKAKARLLASQSSGVSGLSGSRLGSRCTSRATSPLLR